VTRWQKKDQSIASLTDQKAALSKQLEESSKVSKELDEERASMNQLKEQHSLELAKQKTKLEDACKHYQNTLKDEQGKLQLREEELGAANSEISRIKSEVAAKTDAVEAQKALVMELQEKICGLEEDLSAVDSEKTTLKNALAEKSHLLALALAPAPKNRGTDPVAQPQSALKVSASSAGAQSVKIASSSAQKPVQRFSSFNPSASPPSAKKHRESPKTKKRDKTKVLSVVPSNATTHNRFY
jgi:chromosome segregation ATPase